MKGIFIQESHTNTNKLNGVINKLETDVNELETKLIQKRNINHRKKCSRNFSPAEVEDFVMEFIKNEIGMCRFNFTSKKWHGKNPNASSIVFGFRSYDETAHCTF